MSARRPSVLAFLRDFALSLPAFHVQRQRVIVDGALVPVQTDALRPDGPLARMTVQEPRVASRARVPGVRHRGLHGPAAA
jgi:hypothetical protein